MCNNSVNILLCPTPYCLAPTEGGRVYVYRSLGGRAPLQKIGQLLPLTSGGRFGSAIAQLGDIDRDDFTGWGWNVNYNLLTFV